MKETNKVTAEAMEEEEEEEEEERYVKVGTRFYRVTMRPNGGGGAGDAVARRRRRLHYLESCYLCKQSIACDRDVFMYKYVRAPSRHRSSSSPSSHHLPPFPVRSFHACITHVHTGGTRRSAARTAGTTRWTWTRRSTRRRGATASCSALRRPPPRSRRRRRRRPGLRR